MWFFFHTAPKTKDWVLNDSNKGTVLRCLLMLPHKQDLQTGLARGMQYVVSLVHVTSRTNCSGSETVLVRGLQQILTFFPVWPCKPMAGSLRGPTVNLILLAVTAGPILARESITPHVKQTATPVEFPLYIFFNVCLFAFDGRAGSKLHLPG